MFTEAIELTPTQSATLKSIEGELRAMGFDPTYLGGTSSESQRCTFDSTRWTRGRDPTPHPRRCYGRHRCRQCRGPPAHYGYSNCPRSGKLPPAQGSVMPRWRESWPTCSSCLSQTIPRWSSGDSHNPDSRSYASLQVFRPMSLWQVQAKPTADPAW